MTEQEILNNNQESNKKTIDISPLGKWKRILVYLCDLVICFFAAFIIMNAMSIPIGKASSGYSVKMEASEEASKSRDQILYDNQLLFLKFDEDQNDFDSALRYTSECYMLSYVKDDEPSFKQYDVIRHYFVDIRKDEQGYLTMMQEKDKNFGFFDFSSGQPVLKDTYKAQFKPGLPPDNEVDKMSKEGEKNFNLFKEKIFLSSYSQVFSDIEKNDLIHNGVSFNALQKIVDDNARYFDVLVISSTLISTFLSGIIFFLIIPLCNRNGKTVSMMMLRVERVNILNIYLLRKSQVALTSVYQIVASLGCLLFVPVPSVPLYYVFSLDTLLVLSLLAMGICIGSFIFLMFNKYNRTLFDFLSRSVYISSDSLDEIYRSKGYEI